MATASPLPTQVARKPLLSRESLRSSLVGLALLFGWLLLFTVGSQLPSERYRLLLSSGEVGLGSRSGAALMLVLTSQVPSICMLGIFASSLGAWRRRNLDGETGWAAPTYVSAAVSGLVSAITIQAFPQLTSAVLPFSPDQSTYGAFALVSSFVGFVSGYDKNFFDRLIAACTERWFSGGRQKPSPPGESRPG